MADRKRQARTLGLSRTLDWYWKTFLLGRLLGGMYIRILLIAFDFFTTNIAMQGLLRIC